MKKSVWWIILSIGFILIFLIVLGLGLNKEENEKRQGFSGIYDVSPAGMLAYLVYHDGMASIYLQEDGKVFENPVVQLDAEQEILDLDFSADGASLAFVATNKEEKENLGSAVHLLTVSTLETETLFEDKGLITELAFDPKEQNLLFYLKAATFENYSPIASARPHDLDLFSYQMSDDEHIRLTELEKYSMASLNISSTESIAYVQMFDDEQSATAEDIFGTKQRVFQIPLNGTEKHSVISALDYSEDIYDFTIIPNRHEFIFQSVNGTNQDGIFEYELFHYNWETGEEEQLTRLKEYAARPVINVSANKVYYLVDKQFGKKTSNYTLHKMDMDGTHREEVELEGISLK